MWSLFAKIVGLPLIRTAFKAVFKKSAIGKAIKECSDVFLLAKELAKKYEDVDDDAKRLKIEVEQALRALGDIF